MAGAKHTSLRVAATKNAKLSFDPKAKVVSYDENMIKMALVVKSGWLPI